MATKRVGISKRIRFEVFKRDGFACQYCGVKAPEVVLHVDHIEPVSRGGANEILNYITACSVCNLGKAAVPLDDQSALAKQRAQLEELNDRREQLEAMIAWRDGLRSIEDQKVWTLAHRLNEAHPGWTVNDHGIGTIRELLTKVPFDLVLEATDTIALTFKLGPDLKATEESTRGSLSKICALAHAKLRDRTDPGLSQIYYVRGIARKRCFDWNDDHNRYALALLTRARRARVAIDDMKAMALRADEWFEFEAGIESLIRGVRG